MTQDKKNRIIELRNAGIGYGEIAKELNMEKSAVHKFCSRNLNNASSTICKCCGKKIVQIKKLKKRVFCSAECRNNWWNKNRNMLKISHVIKCLECGCEFDYGKHKEQKFCSFYCYNKHRSIGGEANE